MNVKCLTTLIFLLMSEPFIQYAPGQTSPIALDSAQVKMTGLLEGRPQDFRSDLPSFVQAINAVNLQSFGNDPNKPIIIKNTAFVTANQTFSSGEVERLDMPFSSLQDAVNAIPAGALNWLVVVYPGSYLGDIVMTDNLNLYCYGGVTIQGNITLGNNTHLEFNCGAVLNGDILDGGVSVISNICGCLVHEGQITLSGTNTVLTAHGDQMWKASITDATFNCYFGKMKTDNDAIILGAGVAVIKIYGLIANGNFNTFPIDFSGSELYLYNTYIRTIGTDGAIFFDGTIMEVRNSEIYSGPQSLVLAGSGICSVFDSFIESSVVEAILAIPASTLKIILRRNHITVANSSTASVDAIIISTGNFLILEGNSIIAKGTGTCVTANGAVNIKSLIGNGSNRTVDTMITETVDNIFVSPFYE